MVRLEVESEIARLWDQSKCKDSNVNSFDNYVQKHYVIYHLTRLFSIMEMENIVMKYERGVMDIGVQATFIGYLALRWLSSTTRAQEEIIQFSPHRDIFQKEV